MKQGDSAVNYSLLHVSRNMHGRDRDKTSKHMKCLKPEAQHEHQKVKGIPGRKKI